MNGALVEQVQNFITNQETSWRQLEIEVDGNASGNLKRKMVYNIDKLNAMLKPLGVELALQIIENNGKEKE